MVGVRGLEPPASTSRTWRATVCATPRKIIQLCAVISMLASRTLRASRLRYALPAVL